MGAIACRVSGCNGDLQAHGDAGGWTAYRCRECNAIYRPGVVLPGEGHCDAEAVRCEQAGCDGELMRPVPFDLKCTDYLCTQCPRIYSVYEACELRRKASGRDAELINGALEEVRAIGDGEDTALRCEGNERRARLDGLPKPGDVLPANYASSSGRFIVRKCKPLSWQIDKVHRSAILAKCAETGYYLTATHEPHGADQFCGVQVFTDPEVALCEFAHMGVHSPEIIKVSACARDGTMMCMQVIDILEWDAKAWRSQVVRMLSDQVRPAGEEQHDRRVIEQLLERINARYPQLEARLMRGGSRALDNDYPRTMQLEDIEAGLWYVLHPDDLQLPAIGGFCSEELPALAACVRAVDWERRAARASRQQQRNKQERLRRGGAV